MKEKRIQNVVWKFADFPPRKKRIVYFSIMRLNAPGEIYFVNNSPFVLDRVSTSEFGFCGEAIVNCSAEYIYEDIKKDEAVKVAEYDNYYDLDYTLGLTIFLECKELGKLSIRPKMGKGGVNPQPLMYEGDEQPLYVSINKIDDNVR